MMCLFALVGVGKAQTQMTSMFNDGTVTNKYIPVYGYYGDALQQTQFVQPAADLVALAGGTISGMKFYSNRTSAFDFEATFEVSLKEVGFTALESFDDMSGAALVFQGGLTVADDGTMSLTFDNPYTYNGGNLLVNFEVTAVGTYWTSTNAFYGISTTENTARYEYQGWAGLQGASQQFLPKMEVTYTPDPNWQPIPVTSITASDVTLMEGKTAQIEWTVLPADASFKAVSFASSDESIATVSSSGLVTGVAVGNTTVTITSTEYPEISTTAAVTVTEAPSLNAALNVEGGTLEFTNSDTYPWTVEEEGDRIYAKSGNGGVASSYSTLTLDVVGPGDLSFDYKAWGEGTNWDVCVFAIDGTNQFSYGNIDNDWTTYTAEIGGGNHTLSWTYRKDGSTNPLGDYFALDNVAYEQGEIIPVTGITLDPTSLTLSFGHTAQLTASVVPEDASDKLITYTSSDLNVVTVSSTGVLTFVGEGTATITATTNDGGFTATCEVTCTIVQVEEITASDVTVMEGNTSAIDYAVLPEDASYPQVSFSSADETIATVNSNGVVTGITAGTTTVTISTTHEPVVSKTINVTVTENPNLVVNVATTSNTYIPFYGNWADAYQKAQWIQPASTLTRLVGSEINSVTFFANHTDFTYDGPFLIYLMETQDTEVYDFVDPVDEGATQVYEGTLSFVDNRMTVEFSPSYYYLGGNLQFSLVLNSTDGNYSSASFLGTSAAGASVQGYNNSALESVAVSARNFLPQMEFAYTAGGPQVPVTGITIPSNSMELYLGEAGEITYTITPDDATIKLVSVTSSDPTVATVPASNNTGSVAVTPVGLGTTTITLTTIDGGFTATCEVTVIPHLVESINATDLTLGQGHSTTINYTVLPVNASNPAVTFTSADETIATVNENGVVHGVAVGTTTITITATDGSEVSTTIDVTVEQVYEIVIGEGTENINYLPTNSYYKYSYAQQVFLAEELLPYPCTITSLTLFYNANIAYARDVVVYMKNTATASFSPEDKIFDEVSTDDQVFAGMLSISAPGELTITLDTPFEYDGESNLLLAFDDNTNDWKNNMNFQSDNMENNMAIIGFSDAADIDPFTLEGSFSRSVTKKRNHIIFTYNPVDITSWSITLSSNGVEDEPIVTMNAIELPTPDNVPEGFEFAGWKKEGEDAFLTSPFQPSGVNSDITLVAYFSNEAGVFNRVYEEDSYETLLENPALYVKAGVTLTADEVVNPANAAGIVIEDGGYFKFYSMDDVKATLLKHITGYGTGNNAWTLLSAPVLEMTADDLAVDGGYDLYAFDEAQDLLEWRNHKTSPVTTLVSCKGYLYAAAADKDLRVEGTLASQVDKTIPMDYTETVEHPGYNLLGNPFSCKAYLTDGRTFYRMNADGTELVPATGLIEPFEAVFVVATFNNENVVIAPEE